MGSTMEMRLNPCMSLGSQLPFIFVNGRPACLETMTVPQLKLFIQLMLECEGLGNKIPTAENIAMKNGKPKWWPANIDYSPEIYDEEIPKSEHEEKLRNIVRRCYQHYNLCTFINLSSILSDPNGLFGVVKVDDNGNGTSNIVSFSNQLVATVRTKVVKYDENIILQHQKLVIIDSIYNRPVFHLIQQKFKTFSDIPGKVELPVWKMQTVEELNPTIFLRPSLHFINNGKKILFPKSENTAKTNRSGKSVASQNVEKNSKISDSLRNRTSTNKVNPQLRNRTPKGNKTAANVLPSPPPQCIYCGQMFSGQDFCEEHEQDCRRAPKSSCSETESKKKTDFLSWVGLVPTLCPAPKIPPVEVATSRHDLIINELNVKPFSVGNGKSKKRVIKPKPKRMATFFKTHPIPFTSGLGLELVKNSDTGKCTEEEKTLNLDKLTSTTPLAGRSIPVAGPSNSWPTTTLKKNIISNSDAVHTYTSSNRQRIKRNTELVLGMSAKVWDKYNQCKTSSTKLKRLTSSELSKATVCCEGCNDIKSKVQALKKKKGNPRGGSLDAIVRLTDIKADKKYSKYFQNAQAK